MPAFICGCVALALVLSYPLRGLFIGITNWLPVLFFFVMPYTFQQLTIIWLFLYFGTAASVAVWLMKRPFESLIRDMEDVERAIEAYEAEHSEDK